MCAFGSELGWAGHEWEGACAGPGAKPWDGGPASLLICLEDPGPQRGLCWSVPLALLLGAGRPPVDAVVTVVAPAWPCCTQGIDLVISSTSSPSVQSWVGILPPGDICNVYGHFFPSELGWGRHWHVDIVDPSGVGIPPTGSCWTRRSKVPRVGARDSFVSAAVASACPVVLTSTRSS